MSNKLPLPPTEMCEPVIAEFDVYTFFKYNELQLRKAIDDYWASRRKTYATGRIKRLSSRRESRYVRLDKRLGKQAFHFSSDDYCPIKTRWNKH